MKNENLCLNCKLAVWIRCKADLGRLPRRKRKEFDEELTKVRRDHGVELSEIIFPFIWCPEWKKEQLFPFDNKMLACKYFKEQAPSITPQQRLQLKSQLAERTKVRRRKEDERRQHIYK